MSSFMGSHGVAWATAVAAFSGTVILLAVCRQKPFSITAGNRSPTSPRRNLRSCVSSDETKREREGKMMMKKKKKKRVHFGKDVVVEFGRESRRGDEEDMDLVTEFVPAGIRQQMPPNRVALYQGILQDRLQRMACSY